MSLARRYNRLLRRHTLHFAAWSPIIDPHAVGDYGLLDRGIFRKMGHISEFGITPDIETGTVASFDFTSVVSTVVRIEGNAEVPAFSNATDIGASLKFNFEGKFAALVKSPKVEVRAMRSVHQVAQKLHASPGWKPRFRVISKVYTGTNAVVVASVDNTTGIELKGSAKALRMFELGEAVVGVSVSGAHQIQVVGQSGPLAIDLFRVRRTSSIPLMLGTMDLGAEEPDDPIDGSENWDSDTNDLGEP